MKREDLDGYISAFNVLDFQTMRKYYNDDVRLELPNGPNGEPRIFIGPDAIFKFYGDAAHLRDEYLELKFVAIDKDRVAIELYTEFRAKQNTPQFFAGPLQPGDVFVLECFVLYELENDKFKNIRVAPFKTDASRVKSWA